MIGDLICIIIINFNVLMEEEGFVVCGIFIIDLDGVI